MEEQERHDAECEPVVAENWSEMQVPVVKTEMVVFGKVWRGTIG